MLKKIMVLTILLGVVIVSGYSIAQTIPKYLNYQAVLFDEGGNPLPDGSTRVDIRILDENLDVVYEEQQDVEVVSGVVSIMIGSGIDPAGGAPTGGIAVESLLPEGPRYLEVEAEGYPAEDLMELVSVPYSTYADVALSVADGVVDSSQIKNGSITMDHLTSNLVSEITNKITGGEGSTIVVKEEFNEYKNTIASSSGAGQIGINPDFTYSSSADVQNVLKDFDLSIKKREEDVKAEAKVRVATDTTLQTNIDTEVTTRVAADTTLLANINAEAATRGAADTTLQSNIDIHVGNNTNPHGVTPEQIDAVAKTELYNVMGKIKEEFMPDVVMSIATPQYAGEGRLVFGNGSLGSIDEDNTDFDCIFDVAGTKIVECTLQTTDVDCGSMSLCQQPNEEIIPLFNIYTVCPDGISDMSVSAPRNFDSWIGYEKSHAYGGCYCYAKFSFQIPSVPAPAGLGSYISWKIYKRPIQIP